jgi:hypothetical protein
MKQRQLVMLRARVIEKKAKMQQKSSKHNNSQRRAALRSPLHSMVSVACLNVRLLDC